MRTANKKEDVPLQATILGTETVERTRCEHCHSYYEVKTGGVNRCQFVLLNKCKQINYEGLYLDVTYYSQCQRAASELVDDVWYCSMHSKKLKD